jgi:hypothetical protein
MFRVESLMFSVGGANLHSIGHVVMSVDPCKFRKVECKQNWLDTKFDSIFMYALLTVEYFIFQFFFWLVYRWQLGTLALLKFFHFKFNA